MSKKNGMAILFLAPSLIGVGCFVFVPFADTVIRSFQDTMGEQFVGLANYKTVLANRSFQLACRNTIQFTLAGNGLLLVLTFVTALFLKDLIGPQNYVKTAFLLPMAVPAAAMVLLWKLFFHKNGLISALLVLLGQEPVDFLNSKWAFAVMIFQYLWRNSGYVIVLWTAGLSNIADSLYEAAQLDGAGYFRQMLSITIPCIRPVFGMIGILSMVNSFKIFREAYLLAGAYPYEDIYLIQHIFHNWFQELDVQKMFAAAVLVTLAVLFTIVLLNLCAGERKL